MSSEIKKDDYEPEEGEIQDDDDEMEDALKAEGGLNLSNIKDSDECSKSGHLFLKDEQRSQQKQDCGSYGGKSYFSREDGYVHDKFTYSQGSSRERFRTSGEYKWKYQHRQNDASKDWYRMKFCGGTIGRDRKFRVTKRTSMSKYYSSFFPSPLESKCISNEPLPSFTHFNPSIPTWHWYSRKLKEKNKKTSVHILNKLTNDAKQITACDVNQSHSSLSESPECFSKECNEKDVEKQIDLCPGSASSPNSIEVIEVPRKMPEIITIYDTDEEESNKISNKVTTNISNYEMNAQSQKTNFENDSDSHHFSETLNYKSEITTEINENEDVENNLKALTLTIENIISKPLSNSNVLVTPIVSCSSSGPSNSSCSLSAFQNTSDYDNSNESSSIFVSKNLVQPLQVDVCSSNLTEELESNKENGNFPSYSGNELKNDLPIQNYVSFNKDDDNAYNKNYSSTFNKISFPENTQCFHTGNLKSVLEVTGLVQLNETIYSREFDFKKPRAEKTKNNECNSIQENYVDDSCNTSATQESYSIFERVSSLTDSEESITTNLNIPNKVWDDLKSDENCPEVNNIHVNMENIIQIECKDTLDTDKIDVLIQNTIPNINNGVSKDALKNQIGVLQHDNTLLLQSNSTISSDEYSAMQMSHSEKKEKSVTAQSGVTNRNGEENGSYITDSERNVLWNSCSFPESEVMVKASTVAALKRRATELQTMKNNDSEIRTPTNLKKSENEELIPPVVNSKQRKDTASVHILSESYTPVYSSSLHGKSKNLELEKFTTPMVTHMNSLGNTMNSISKKCFAYSKSALVYEDRIGSNNSESKNLREKIAERINVTVPEFIINLGEESESDDDSGNVSVTKSAKDDEIKEQFNNYPTNRRLRTDFEEKLDTLLKQARYQQELKLEPNNSTVISKEKLKLSSLPFNCKKNYLGKGSTILHHKSVQPLKVNQGCARTTPIISTMKKMSSPNLEKEKLTGYKMKSVAIKNTSDDLHCGRTIHNDYKYSTSEILNSSKQTGKCWNGNQTNRGKYFHATSSLVDIRLLSPLKQKEYLKLQKQIIQMTRKKRKNQNEYKYKSSNYTDKPCKTENAKFKQKPSLIASVRNSKQEKLNHLMSCNEGNSVVHKTLSNIKKTTDVDSECAKLHTALENVETSSDIQTDKDYSHQEICLQETSSESDHNCGTTKAELNIMYNDNDISLHSVLPRIHCNSQEIKIVESLTKPHTTNFLQESSTQQHKHLTIVEKQTQNMTINGCSQETVVYKSEYTLPEKRKSTAFEQVQKKQKTERIENEKSRMKQKDTATKEIMCTLLHNKVLEDLWSSETKLIAKRRQVLEDIVAVRLNLDKIDTVNFRTNQLIRKISHLKEELEQAERQMNSEKQHLKSLNNRIEDSKLCIQNDQSELLSLSLECEELGSKVHGPNYNVPNTCIELIRNEMLVMKTAMQELEN